jgi:hypothetical protein
MFDPVLAGVLVLAEHTLLTESYVCPEEHRTTGSQ